MADATPDLRLLEDVVAPRVLALVKPVEAGLNAEKARSYLEQHSPQLVAKLDQCITQAHAEDV
jgi:hypothetical protein